ncbi:MAG TPA: cohesin domain-containing protein [Acidobacteriota bacterium]|nr:cohesin domain-containing protein [Acidobacteriota bacterium]
MLRYHSATTGDCFPFLLRIALSLVRGTASQGDRLAWRLNLPDAVVLSQISEARTSGSPGGKILKKVSPYLPFVLALLLSTVSAASEGGKDVKPRGAAAPTVEFQADGGSTTVGGTVQVRVEATGLPTGVSPALGAYDLQVGFDPANLTLNSISFAEPLGNEAGGEVVHQDFPGVGTLDAVAVSLLLPADLVSLQQDNPFLLFTLTFEALATGTHPVTLAANASPSDENGNSLPSQAMDGQVQVLDLAEIQEIPTLSEWGLLLLSALLLGAGLMRMRQRGNIGNTRGGL